VLTQSGVGHARDSSVISRSRNTYIYLDLHKGVLMFKILLLTYAISLNDWHENPSINQIELATKYYDEKTCDDVAKNISREFKDGPVKIV